MAQGAGLGRSWAELVKGPDHPLPRPRSRRRNEGLLRLIARGCTPSPAGADRLVFDLQTAVAESFGYLHWSGAPARR